MRGFGEIVASIKTKNTLFDFFRRNFFTSFFLNSMRFGLDLSTLFRSRHNSLII